MKKTILFAGLSCFLYLSMLSSCKKNNTAKPLTTDTLYLGADQATFLSDSVNFPTSGGTAVPELLAESWTVSSIPVTGRSFFQFVLPALSESSVIKSAKLTLYSDTIPTNGDLTDANYGTNNDFYIQRVGSAWNASTVTWLDLPSIDTAGQVYIPQTNSSFLNLVDVDVTTLVNHMIASGNYGFEIRLNNEIKYNSRIFCSGAYSDKTRLPRLILTY